MRYHVYKLCFSFTWMFFCFLDIGESNLNSTAFSDPSQSPAGSALGQPHTTTARTSTFSNETNVPTNGLSITDQALLLNLREKGLYYDLPTIMQDINLNKLKTGIVDLMAVHNRSEWIAKMRQNYQARDEIKKKKRMIFINIETVYSSKREMITKGVARRLRGRQMTSPPKFMGDIRVILGPGVARKLYYSITKYSTAHHIVQVLNTHAVVLERYWLHHAAFIISKALNTSDLPARGHPIYHWPDDLMAPDVLFFVNATKDLGQDTGFHQPYSPFTDSLIKVFRRVEGVKVVEINPSKNYMEIVSYILNYLKENFSDHPDIIVPL